MKQHLPDGEAAVEHDIAEHKELERTMKELEAVDGSDTRFDALITQLDGVLTDHVADEEDEQFPKFRASIPRDELVQHSAGRCRRPRSSRRHGRTPRRRTPELFHKVAGPGVGLVDRLRDRLTGMRHELSVLDTYLHQGPPPKQGRPPLILFRLSGSTPDGSRSAAGDVRV